MDPDPTEQAQELVFSRKVQTTNSPPLFFNENVVLQTTLQKHLEMFLDSKLNFSKYFKTIFQKTNKTIGLLRKLETLFPRAPLLGDGLSFIRPSPNSAFNCHNPKGIKIRSRLRLGLSHLREHKFKHSFQDSLNPFCSCGKVEVEASSHYLLHCSNYSEERLALLNTIKSIDTHILQQSDSKFTSVLLFRNTSFDNKKNTYPRYHYRSHHFDRKI